MIQFVLYIHIQLYIYMYIHIHIYIYIYIFILISIICYDIYWVYLPVLYTRSFLFILYKYTVSYLKHTYLKHKKLSIVCIRTVIPLLFEMFNDFIFELALWVELDGMESPSLTPGSQVLAPRPPWGLVWAERQVVLGDHPAVTQRGVGVAVLPRW